ncbi:MAG: YhgE/Pip domain-containing protein, partial [Propionicimonas sp.]|nr:YhgE/Pip domain-containing protein [Propionicimonas sp.]
NGSELADGAATVADGTTQTARQLADLDDALAKAQQTLEAGDTEAAAAILDQVRQGTAVAHDRAGQLARAAADLNSGIGDLHDGATDLASGAGKLQAGWQQVSVAVAPGGQLASGADDLVTAQADLATGAQQLAFGAATLTSPQARGQVDALAEGANQMAIALTTLSSAASDPATGIPALQAGTRQLLAGFDNPDPDHGLLAAGSALHDGATTLDDGLEQLNDGAGRLGQGAGTLVDGVGRIAGASHELSDGLATLKDNTPALVAGVEKLDDGARQLADGTSTLVEGTTRLTDKTPELLDGLHQLGDGAGDLATSLAKGTDQLPEDNASLRSQRGEAIATPVELSDTHIYQAESWGEGFAPFFIPLALWVGALITWLLLRPLQSRALMTSVNGFRMAWGALNPALGLGLGQVTIMLTVMHLAIGLDAANWVATFGFALLAAAAFFALQQFFQVAFGSAVGKVIVIVLLMVQLASSSGTYPIQTTPEFLQAISGWMPMTYVVAGLREAITGGLETRFWSSVVVLAGIFVVSLLATSIAASRKRMWTMSRLHPALSI